MCGGKKEEKKAEETPLPEAPPESPRPAEEAPPPAEEPKAASQAKSTLSKMSDTRLAADQKSLNLMTTRAKGGANFAKKGPGVGGESILDKGVPSLALTTTRGPSPKGAVSQTMKGAKSAAKK